MIRSLKKALQPSANNVTVKFDLPSSYEEVKVVPDKIPSIYNGEKTVIYGLLMEKSDDKGRDGLMCKAILSGDILGKEFRFEIPFELSGRQAAEEDVSIIHQLAAKVMIQEWQVDWEPHEERHKKEIIELSCDASVVSRYTAYIAVDEAQNKPVSGSMQSYELTADRYSPQHKIAFGGSGGGGGNYTVSRKRSMAWPMAKSARRHMLISPACSMPIQAEVELNKGGISMSGMTKEQCSNDSLTDDNFLLSLALPTFSASSAPPLSKQHESSFIISLQQFDGSWLLNDKLAGVVSKSVEELKSCCPVSCDVTMITNIWATVVVIELLKKKYPSMLEELELVIMKAEQWVGKQVLPSGVDLAVLKDSASKIV